MEGRSSEVIKSMIFACDVKEEDSEVTTDYLSDEKETDTTTSGDGSSTKFSSIFSGPVRDRKAFERHPSVDEWLLGNIF